MSKVKFCLLGMAIFGLVLGGLPVHAGSQDRDIKVHGKVRVRYDHFEDYDFNSDVDDNVNGWPYRTIVGLTGKLADGITAQIDLQAFGDLGNQFGTQNGLGGYSYAGSSFGGSSSGDVDIYQGFVTLEELGGSDWELSLGRREMSLGNELHFGDNDFTNGRTFDGAWLGGEFDGWDLGVMFLNVNETSSTFTESDNDSWILGAHAEFELGDGTIAPYIINWRNNADGPALAFPVPFGSRIDIQTYGALWQRPADGEGWDASVELAFQSGDFGISGAGQQDFGGSVFEGEFGWNFDETRRLHLNYLMASGDDDLGDNDFEQFVQIAPELDSSRLGFTAALQLANIEDISLGYDCGWNDGVHTFHAAFHQLTLAEDNSPFSPFAPFGGGPALVVGEDDLGQEIDIVYGFNYSENAAFQLGVANLFVGDALGPNGDDAMRVWGGLDVTWGK